MSSMSPDGLAVTAGSATGVEVTPLAGLGPDAFGVDAGIFGRRTRDDCLTGQFEGDAWEVFANRDW